MRFAIKPAAKRSETDPNVAEANSFVFSDVLFIRPDTGGIGHVTGQLYC